jgi:CRP-like cAMP-binding protein
MLFVCFSCGLHFSLQFSLFFKPVTFSQNEATVVEGKFEALTLKKGFVLLKVGDVVNHQYFISSGCLRTFFIDSSGKEHTIQLAIKDWWISDYTAFFTNTLAIMTIECIQDATIYKVSKEDMESLYIEIPPIETFFRKKMEGAFASF